MTCAACAARIERKLNKLDGVTASVNRAPRVARQSKAGAGAPPHEMPLSEKDVVLICYGDSLHRAQEKPLKTLQAFAETHLDDVFSTLHILPFFPYSSDDGFSVSDFRTVNPALGDWADIEALAETGRTSERPLLIFPEGNVYLQNDVVTPFHDGAAMLALRSARALADDGARVLVVPVSIKATYVEDVRWRVEAALEELARACDAPAIRKRRGCR